LANAWEVLILFAFNRMAFGRQSGFAQRPSRRADGIAAQERKQVQQQWRSSGGEEITEVQAP